MQILHSYGELASRADRPVYLTVGFFDGVHLGHQFLLKQLREAALVAGTQSLALTFSNSPRRFHQPQLRVPEWHYLSTSDEKLELLAATGVDTTFILEYNSQIAQQTARGFLQGLAAIVPLAGLCVGYDTLIGCDMLSGREQFAVLCSELKIGFTWVEPLLVDDEPVKSSRIRKVIQLGDMKAAARLLGRKYSLAGEVVRGKGKGRKMLGIPTANLALPEEKLLPPLGVYAGVGRVGQKSYPAAVCLSSRQQHAHTVLEAERAGDVSTAEAGPAVPEAHLIGFEGDLYGRKLRLDLTSRLREWRDFESVDQLQNQMLDDIAVASRLVNGDGNEGV